MRNALTIRPNAMTTAMKTGRKDIRRGYRVCDAAVHFLAAGLRQSIRHDQHCSSMAPTPTASRVMVACGVTG
jgi:hypothetical protein